MIATDEYIEVGSLGDIAEVVMGQSPVGTSYNRDGDGAPLINGPTEFARRYPVPKQWTTAPVRFCKAGDELICVRGSSTGRMNTADQAYCIGRGVAAVRARGKNDQSYVRYALTAVVADLLKLQSGSTFPSIDSRVIRGGAIFLPPHNEQVRVGQVLDDVGSQISAIEDLITKKRAIKLGMSQQLLTGRTRLLGFTGEWTRLTIKQIVKTPVTDGPHSTPIFLSEGVPFLSVNNLVDGKIDWADLRFISRCDHELFSKKCHPQRGDVLLGKAASVGKVGYLDTDREVNIWSPIALIRVKDSIEGRFVFYQLQSSATAKQIELLTNTSSQGNIGMGEIEKIELNLPPHSEQVAIAAALSDVDVDIDSLQARLTKARAISTGMMQQLLTGRIRLPEEEAAS